MRTLLLLSVAAVFLGMSANAVMAATPMSGTLTISNSTLSIGQVEQIKFSISGGVSPYSGIIYVDNSTGASLAFNSTVNSVSPDFYLTFIVEANSIVFLQPNGSPSGQTLQNYGYPTGQLSVTAMAFDSTGANTAATGSLYLTAPSGIRSMINIINGGEYNDVLYPGTVSIQYNVTGGIRPYTSWNINVSQAYKSGGTWINTYLSGVSGNSDGIYNPSTGTTSYYYNFTYSNTSGVLKGLSGKTVSFGAAAVDSSGQKTSVSGGLVYLDAPMALGIESSPYSSSVSSNVINYGSDQTFYANVSGGMSGYTYQWAYGHSLSTATKIGTGQSYTFYGNSTTLSESPLYLFVTATDYYGQKNTTDIAVTVSRPASAPTTSAPTTSTSTIASTTTTVNVPTTTTISPTTTITSTTTTPSNTVPQPQEITISVQPGWNMLSLPSPGNDWQSVYNSFASSCGAPETNSQLSSNALWGLESSTNDYVSLNSFTALDNFLITGSSSFAGYGGRGNGNYLGFWFYSSKQCSVNAQTFTAASRPQNDFFLTSDLSAGWNLIGVPYTTTASFNSIASSCNLRGGFYNYNPTTNSYTDAASPTVGDGYFVYATAPCTLNWNAQGSASTGSTSPPSAP